MSESVKKRVCPECGSSDTSSDVEMEGSEHKEMQIVEEFDFCWECGHKFNRTKRGSE